MQILPGKPRQKMCLLFPEYGFYQGIPLKSNWATFGASFEQQGAGFAEKTGNPEHGSCHKELKRAAERTADVITWK